MENIKRNVSAVKIDDLMKVVERVKLAKRIVIFFVPCTTGQVLFGEMIDRLLDCRENEKGFLVPEVYRHYLAEYKDGYVERSPKAIVDHRSIVCPYKFQ